jgi:hypothetical protein
MPMTYKALLVKSVAVDLNGIWSKACSAMAVIDKEGFTPG